MRIDILSILPGLMESPFSDSIMQRAKDKGLVQINLLDIRSWSSDKHGKVDDYAFGGGAGMVMAIQPIDDCISANKPLDGYDEVIYMTPDGERLNQRICNELSLKKNIAIVCGHYKGVDQRFRDHFVSREISIGDYVLSGGELAAAVLVDSIVRLLPGVLNDETSALTDSFQDGLLAPPVYTRPAEYKGWKVPEILLSGDQKKIDEWRFEQSLERTKQRRPDILEGNQ
jgi:tRNA (guanine37-N1)-methyltransferase